MSIVVLSLSSKYDFTLSSRIETRYSCQIKYMCILNNKCDFLSGFLGLVWQACGTFIAVLDLTKQ